MKFSECGPYLETNIGTLDVGPEYKYSNNDTSIAKSKEFCSNVHIYMQDSQWVALAGERVLWFPPEYRPLRSTSYGNTLVLGQASGRISFIVIN